MNTETRQKLREKIAEAIERAETKRGEYPLPEWLAGLAEAVLEALLIEDALVWQAHKNCWAENVFRLRVLEEGSPET